MTWITPLLAIMSVLITFASSTRTPLDTETVMLLPSTVGALESIASQCLQRNRIEEAIQACLLVTRAEPLRESAHRLLARAHAAEGNPAQALQQLDHYAEILEREIGATPSRFTIDLRSQLSSAVEGDESPQPPTPA